MANQNYGEVLCQAVDEIVRKRLEGISYDQTILCTIVNDDKREQGIYTVTNNGSVKFEAVSENTSYRENDNVYVQIPGGDWNQQKFILAKRKEKTEEPFIYESPFDSLVDITGNRIVADSIVGLVANGEIKETLIGEWNEKDSINEPPLAAYSRLGLSGSFQSWLNPAYDEKGDLINISHGDYGYRLEIMAENEKISTDSDSNNIYELYLSCSDMIGNPYNFSSYFHQEKVFDISEIGKIKSMALYFYQSSNFTDGASMMIPTEDFLGDSIPSNLFTKDAYVTLGYDTHEFDSEMVTIYSLQPTTYSRTASSDYNKKNIQLRWIHEKEDGNFISIDSDSALNYEVYWYRYELGHASADKYSGVYWTHYASQKTQIDANQNVVEHTYESPAKFFEISFAPDVTIAEEQIKAIIIYNGKAYRSNILTLTNEDEVVSKPTVDAVQALSIVVDDDTYGNYRIYGQNGSLLDMAQRNTERSWTAHFKSSLDNTKVEPTPLTEAESIEWIIPTKNTMIVVDSDIEPDNNGYVHIIRTPEANGHIQPSQSYKIKSYYSQSYSNNTVQCKIVKNNTTYTATKELTFGTAGTTGTDYTFILDFDKGITAVTADSNDAVFVTARLYDYENNEIDISDRKITWSWKGNDPNVDISEDKLLQIYPAYQDEAQLKIKTISCEIKRTATAWSGVNYGILQASMDWGDWKLIAYLPIPIRSSTNYSYISGTTQVIYNSAGEIINCARNPYVLYNNSGAKVTVDTSDGWKCYDENGVWETTDNTRSVYAPTIKYTKDTNNNITGYYLSPLSFYVKDACEKICVTAAVSGTIVWSQPILIMQNTYPSAMLNEWDGALKIDESKGAILASRMVAGIKNDDDNTFSGIVLGNWGSTDSDNSLTSGDTGLYGFDHGQQSYGFLQDGTAFIGKSGAGRIEFKGNTGIIESSNYSVGAAGMSINLKDGIIDAHDFTLTANGSQKVNTGTENQPNMQWRNGSITLTTNSDVSPLSIGSYFSVDWDGTLHAAAGDFSGIINATDGTFAGTIKAYDGELWDLDVKGTLKGGTISGTTITTDNGTFYVNSDGDLTATSATIGGWSITSSASGLSNGNFQLSPDGILKMKNITIDGDGKITLGPGGNASITIDGTTTDGKITFGNTSKKTTIDGNNISVSNLFIYDPTNSSTYAGKMMYMAPDYGGNETDINNQGFTGIGFSSAPKDENGNTPDSILKLTQYHVGASHKSAYWVLDNSGFYAAYKYGGSIKATSNLIDLSIGSTNCVKITSSTTTFNTDVTVIGDLTVNGTCTGVYATLV